MILCDVMLCDVILCTRRGAGRARAERRHVRDGEAKRVALLESQGPAPRNIT